ncbi:MAG: argininosuccinate lyase [Acidobacteria bacterium]|nr:argininosuccinate lyase [Acidobacteriota bacterium]
MPEPGAQLWAKDLPLDAVIHRFTVGEDPELDLQLLPWDCLGSAAHARMLAEAGLLPGSEARLLVDGLRRILNLAGQGAFHILPEQEDGHTAIEAELTRMLGETGKRIHLGRSRNDQVILALRLLMRDAALRLGLRAAQLADAFLAFAEAHRDEPMPGYTHLRRAMPSSWGQWGQAFAEGLLEELQALPEVFRRLDKCPLGAAAGFGVPLPLQRERVADLLAFAGVQRSPVDVINSRGRHELALLGWLASLAGVVEKALWDLSLYSMEEFGFVKVPDAFTTGSSIMPQKRNPDVVELARGKCSEIRGWAGLLRELATGLPSNYHRDFQLQKKPLLAGLRAGEELLEVLNRLVPVLQVDAEASRRASTPELHAAHKALRLAAQGLPFREAYRAVAEELKAGTFAPDPVEAEATHTGGTANLGLEACRAELAEARAWVDRTKARLDSARDAVWDGGLP